MRDARVWGWILGVLIAMGGVLVLACRNIDDQMPPFHNCCEPAIGGCADFPGLERRHCEGIDGRFHVESECSETEPRQCVPR